MNLVSNYAQKLIHGDTVSYERALQVYYALTDVFFTTVTSREITAIWLELGFYVRNPRYVEHAVDSSSRH